MKKRIVYLDIARSIAIISVSFNHAVNRSFAIVSNTQAEYVSIPLWITVIKVILYAFSRIGLPLFLMITGNLLLHRNYRGNGTKRFLKHNWLQLLITTEIWMIFMFWYKQLLPESLLPYGMRVCFIRFVETILFINPFTMDSMWYMFMILCLYLFIPILSVSLEELNPKYFLVPFVIIILSGFALNDINLGIKILGYASVLTSRLQPAYIFPVFAIFLLFGHYIGKGILSNIKTKTLVLLLVCSFAAFCGLQLWTYKLGFDYRIGYLSMFTMIVAVCSFELIRRVKLGNESRIAKAAAFIARISLGIYFIHICIMDGLWAIVEKHQLHTAYLSKFIIFEVVSFGGSIVIIQILRRNKWISKHVLGIKPSPETIIK